MLLAREPTHIGALETVMSLAGDEWNDSALHAARAGIKWLDGMLSEYHATHIAGSLRKLVDAGLDPLANATALNDAGLDELYNASQPFGEWHVRKACKTLGLTPRAVRWSV